MRKQEVYVLLSDSDGTLRSTCEPFGVAVTTEEEAKKFVAEGNFGYFTGYEKLVVFDNKDEAIAYYSKNKENNQGE